VSLAEIIEEEAERVRVGDLIKQVTLTHMEETVEREGETHSLCGSMECPAFFQTATNDTMRDSAAIVGHRCCVFLPLWLPRRVLLRG
jgi:hypothetical protein